MTSELSDREKESLNLLVKFGSDKVIARELGLSHRTVEHHLQNVANKTRIKDRVLLAVWWDRKTRSAA